MGTVTLSAIVIPLATIAGAALGAATYAGLRVTVPAWDVEVMLNMPEEVDPASIVGEGEDGTLQLTPDLLAKIAVDPAIDRSDWGKAVRLPERREAMMREALRLTAGRDTRKVVLNCRQRSRSDAEMIVGVVVECCAKPIQKARFLRNREAFETKQTQVEEQIRNLKTEIQDFIRRNGITSGTEGGLTDQGTANNLARIRDDTIRDLTLAQARLDSVDRKLREQRYEDEDRRLAMHDPAVRQVEQILHQVQTFLSSSRERFGEEHPQVKDLVQRETAARDRMKMVLDETMQRKLQADKLDFSERVASLKSLVERQTQDLTDSTKRLQQLTAQISALDALKEQLTQRERERADLQDLIAQFDILQGRADGQVGIPVADARNPRNSGWAQAVLATAETRLAWPNFTWCVAIGAGASASASAWGLAVAFRTHRRRMIVA